MMESICASIVSHIDSYIKVFQEHVINSENQFILLPHGLQTKNVVYSNILREQYFQMYTNMFSYLYALISSSVHHLSFMQKSEFHGET